ncbi:MAG TPA: hypothetical protein V6D26_17660 [Stenomitos sp.]
MPPVRRLRAGHLISVVQPIDDFDATGGEISRWGEKKTAPVILTEIDDEP